MIGSFFSRRAIIIEALINPYVKRVRPLDDYQLEVESKTGSIGYSI